MRNIQELRGDKDLLDNGTKLEHGYIHNTQEMENIVNKYLTTVIDENRQDKKLMMKNRL